MLNLGEEHTKFQSLSVCLTVNLLVCLSFIKLQHSLGGVIIDPHVHLKINPIDRLKGQSVFERDDSI